MEYPGREKYYKKLKKVMKQKNPIILIATFVKKSYFLKSTHFIVKKFMESLAS